MYLPEQKQNGVIGSICMLMMITKSMDSVGMILKAVNEVKSFNTIFNVWNIWAGRCNATVFLHSVVCWWIILCSIPRWICQSNLWLIRAVLHISGLLKGENLIRQFAFVVALKRWKSVCSKSSLSAIPRLAKLHLSKDTCRMRSRETINLQLGSTLRLRLSNGRTIKLSNYSCGTLQVC